MSAGNIFIVSVITIALLGLLAGCGQKEESAQMKEPAGMDESMPMDEPAREAEVMSARVLDPACGMEVDPETALSAEYQGHIYYFCSAQCRDSFLKDPGKYVSEEQMMEKGVPGGGDHMEMNDHRMGEDEDRPMTGEEEHQGHGH